MEWFVGKGRVRPIALRGNGESPKGRHWITKNDLSEDGPPEEHIFVFSKSAEPVVREFVLPTTRASWWPIPDGIITQLKTMCGGNVHVRGAAAVSASGALHSDRQKAAYQVDDSDDDPSQWLYYDFKERIVRPTDYAIARNLSAA
jgi:hypothetical protein